MNKTLPVKSWASLLEQLNIDEAEKITQEQQEAIAGWCRQYIKSDFEFDSLAATKALVEGCIKLDNDYSSLSAVVDSITNCTVLHKAAMLGLDQFLKVALEANSCNINLINNNLNTALHYAVYGAHFKTVEFLFEYGANANAINKDNKLPLNLVTRNYLSEPLTQRKKIFLYLLERTDKKLLNLSDTELKRTLILDLVALNDFDFIDPVLKINSNLRYALDKRDQNILHLAIIEGSNNIVEKFMTDKKLLGQKTDNNSTVLHLAARYNRVILPALLKELGSMTTKLINVQDERGNTALHYLTENDTAIDDNLIKQLIDAGAKEDIPNHDGRLPIQSQHSFFI
ncbi:ankyrin repeat domain-containing protein [Legionella sp. D16C41]|uniref:ankyrin repeat domain-containing protein n=1 Tax=Legionella sp. D16C41 TaxID=3402688 RepID=UPI003AF75CF9